MRDVVTCNAACHWQGTNLESTLEYRHWKPRVGIRTTLSSHWWHCRFLSWKLVVTSPWRKNPSTLLGHLWGESTGHLRRIALKLSLLLVWKSSSTNNGVSGDLRRNALLSIFSIVPILSYKLPVSLWSVPWFCINTDDFSVWPTGSESSCVYSTLEVIDCPQGSQINFDKLSTSQPKRLTRPVNMTHLYYTCIYSHLNCVFLLSWIYRFSAAENLMFPAHVDLSVCLIHCLCTSKAPSCTGWYLTKTETNLHYSPKLWWITTSLRL